MRFWKTAPAVQLILSAVQIAATLVLFALLSLLKVASDSSAPFEAAFALEDVRAASVVLHLL